MRTLILSTLLLGGSANLLAEVPASPYGSLAEAPDLERSRLKALWNAAILRDGSIAPTLEALRRQAESNAASKQERARSWFVLSDLLWRAGRLPEASSAALRATELSPGPREEFQLGRIQEALGEAEAAEESYTRALSQAPQTDLLREIALRRVLLSTTPAHVGDLVEYSKTQDTAFRNRVAVILGMLGHPELALQLYEVTGDELQRRRQQLRRAEWAIRCGRAEAAQEAAWQALAANPAPRDLHYALALLVDAHALDKSWDRLLARLEKAKGAPSEFNAVKLDVLGRLGRLDEAIAFLTSLPQDTLPPSAHRLLLDAYAQAGRLPEMQGHLEKLLKQDPESTEWPAALCEYHLEQGNRALGVRVWLNFAAAQRETGKVLAACRRMEKMGLDEEALGLALALPNKEPSASYDVQRFAFEHHLKRGHSAKAGEILEALDRSLAPDASERLNLAADFERLRLPHRALAIWKGLEARPAGLSTDQKMRVAWLCDSVGLRAEAFGRWLALWREGLPEARLRLVEDRLLALGAETGALGDVAIGIEERLGKGEASARERSFLIRIYTAVDDPASAVEVIQEYFNKGENKREAQIAGLKEEAKVYRLLGRNKAYERATRELLALDADNASEYRQSLLITQVEGKSKPSPESLDEQLAELRRLDPSLDEGFAAGIYRMAGLSDRAVSAFEATIARNPSATEYHLVLADTLARQNRPEEAIAMLQHLADTAESDEALVVALDGILNLHVRTGPTSLSWGQRRVFAAIAAHDDKYFLYELASEVADGLNDARIYLASLESALADAGQRRSSVLRELISATADQPAGFNVINLPDPERHLRYSRWLTSLGEELPPSAHLDLGESLARQGFVREALAVFRAATEQAGDLGLRERAGDRLLAAGLKEEAGRFYEQALRSNAGDSALTEKLARLRYEAGDLRTANRLRLDAVLWLAERQLLHVETPTGSDTGQEPAANGVSFVLRESFDDLRNALLFTTDSSSRPAVLARLREAFDEACRLSLDTTGERRRPLSEFPRLLLVSDLVRTCALQLSEYELAEHVDARLRADFTLTERQQEQLAQLRSHFGRPSPFETPKAGAPSAAAPSAATSGNATEAGADLIEAAVALGRYGEAIRLATTLGSEQRAVELYRLLVSRAAQAAPSPIPPEYQQLTPDGNGVCPAALLKDAHRRLPPAKWSELCRLVFNQTASPALTEGIVCSGIGGLSGVIEQTLGHDFIDAGRLGDLLRSAPPPQASRLDFVYAAGKLRGVDWAAPARRVISSPESRSEGVGSLLQLALDQGLGAAREAELLEAFEVRYSKRSDDALKELVAQDLSALRDFLAAKDGRNPNLRAEIKSLLKRYLDRINNPVLTTPEAARETKPDEALAQLVSKVPGNTENLEQAIAALATNTVFSNLSDAEFNFLIQATIEEGLSKARAGSVEPGLLAALVFLERMHPGTPSAAYETLAKTWAVNADGTPCVLEAAAELCRISGWCAQERILLEKLLKREPGLAQAKERLLDLLVHFDAPVERLALLETPGKNPPEGAASPRPASLTVEPRSFMEALLENIPRQPGDLEKGRERLEFFELPEGYVQPFLQAASNEANDVLERFFPSFESLLRVPPSLGDLVQHASDPVLMRQESQRLLQVLHPETLDQDDLAYLVSWLAEASVRDGSAADLRDKLGTKLHSGNGGTKELLMWMELVLRLPESTSPESRTQTSLVLSAPALESHYATLLQARLAARAGEYQRASAFLTVNIARSLAKEGTRFATDGRKAPLLSVQGQVEEAARLLPQEFLQPLILRTVNLIEGSDGPQQERNGAEILWLVRFALSHGAASSAFKDLDLGTVHTASAQVRQIALRFHLGDAEGALKALATLLNSTGSECLETTASYRGSARSMYSIPLHLLVAPGDYPADSQKTWAARVAAFAEDQFAGRKLSPYDYYSLMAMAAKRQQELGDEAGRDTFKRLARHLLETPITDGRLASLISLVSQSVGEKLSVEQIDFFLALGSLDPEAAAHLLSDLAAQDKLSTALLHARNLLEQSQNERLLQVCESLAQAAGDADLLARLAFMRSEASRARLALRQAGK